MADSMTAPAPPKATQGQGELKRALWNIVKAWDEEYGSDGDYDALLDHLLARLAAGTPGVIEAMARAHCRVSCDEIGQTHFCEQYRCPSWNDDRRMGEVRAALAAGMKVIAEGGEE